MKLAVTYTRSKADGYWIGQINDQGVVATSQGSGLGVARKHMREALAPALGSDLLAAAVTFLERLEYE